MLEVKELTKKYSSTLANDHLNFSLNGGEIGILLGPNGAGKSTAIKCIMGLLRFSGTITIDGNANKSEAAKRIMGYVPEIPALYELLTVEEHAEFIIRAYKLDKSAYAYADELMERLELTDKKKKLGKELSKGMQQKVSIMCALLPRPKMLLLDEPLLGLSPAYQEIVINGTKAIRDSKGISIIITEQYARPVMPIIDYGYILENGSTVLTGTRDELMDNPDVKSAYFGV